MANSLAGTKRVLASLWSVAADSTSVLLSRFYRSMASGHDKPRDAPPVFLGALRLARRLALKPLQVLAAPVRAPNNAARGEQISMKTKNPVCTLQVLGTVALLVAAIAGCNGSDGGPSPAPTATTASTPTATATASAGATATATAITGPTQIPTPGSTPSPTAPVQFRGLYSGATSSSTLPQITFRVNAQRQVTGQVVALNSSGVGFTLPLRGTISVAASDANNPGATAFLDLSASGSSGTLSVTYRFTGTISSVQSVVSGSGTALTQFGDQSRSETLQVRRVSN
jgi:hypothetical protein